jgi:hypothetical protein
VKSATRPTRIATPGSLTGATVAGGGYFLQKNFNLGVSVVSGFDLQINYKHALPGRWGSLSASPNGAYLWHETSTPYLRDGPREIWCK